MLQGMKTMNDTTKDNSINRRIKVMEQRLSGISYREIAKALKISHSTAKRDYEQAISEQFEYNSEEVNRQRNKAQVILDKLIESNSRFAFGKRIMEKDMIGRDKEFDPEEDGTESYFVDIKTKEIINNHNYIEDHFDDETEEWICIGKTCEYITRRFTGKELQQVKENWLNQNSYYSKPDKESQKVIIECIKLMKDIWGFNSGASTTFDQRKQTIHIKGETNETL